MFAGPEIWRQETCYCGWSTGNGRTRRLYPEVACPEPYSWEFCGSSTMYKCPEKTFARIYLSYLLLIPRTPTVRASSRFLMNTHKITLGPEGIAELSLNHIISYLETHQACLPLRKKTSDRFLLRPLSLISGPYLFHMTGLKLVARGPDSACSHILIYAVLACRCFL